MEHWLEVRLRKIESDSLQSGEAAGHNRDVYDHVVLELEKLNHASVEKLDSLGFKMAKLGMKSIKRVDEEVASRESIRTYPGSIRRQDLLETAHTAGFFFQFTDGGAAMNCDDMLMLAVEWKMMKKKAEQIERKKDTINRRNAIVEDALSIFAKGGGPDKLPEYKTCIMWKMKIEKERRCKHMRVPVEKEWTEDRQFKLEKLQIGDISQVKDTVLFKRANARKCTFLDAQTKFVSDSERLQLLLSG